MNPVIAVARDTWRQVFHARLYRVLWYGAALVIVASFFVAKLTIGNWDRTILDLGLSAIEIFSVVLAAYAGASLATEPNGENPGSHPQRDGSRRAYFAGRYLGFLTICVASVAALLLALTVVLAIAEFAPSIAALSATLLLLVQAAFLGVVALFVSAAWSRTIGTAAAVVLFVAGHASTALLDLGEHNGSAITKAATTALYWILPNLELFNAKPDAANRLDVSLAFTSSSVGYGALSAAAVFALALAVVDPGGVERRRAVAVSRLDESDPPHGS